MHQYSTGKLVPFAAIIPRCPRELFRRYGQPCKFHTPRTERSFRLRQSDEPDDAYSRPGVRRYAHTLMCEGKLHCKTCICRRDQLYRWPPRSSRELAGVCSHSRAVLSLHVCEQWHCRSFQQRALGDLRSPAATPDPGVPCRKPLLRSMAADLEGKGDIRPRPETTGPPPSPV